MVQLQADAFFAGEIGRRSYEKNCCELYKQSVKRQLLSDVPLGLLLSGGVDSGLLLALMNLIREIVAHLHGWIRLKLCR